MDLSHRKKINEVYIGDIVGQLQHRIYLKIKEFGIMHMPQGMKY